MSKIIGFNDDKQDDEGDKLENEANKLKLPEGDLDFQSSFEFLRGIASVNNIISLSILPKYQRFALKSLDSELINFGEASNLEGLIVEIPEDERFVTGKNLGISINSLAKSIVTIMTGCELIKAKNKSFAQDFSTTCQTARWMGNRVGGARMANPTLADMLAFSLESTGNKLGNLRLTQIDKSVDIRLEILTLITLSIDGNNNSLLYIKFPNAKQDLKAMIVNLFYRSSNILSDI